MSLLTKDLPEALKKQAEEELGEDPETLDEDIQRLRERVLEVEGLRSRTDDAFLLRFLRAKKFDEYRALDTIKNYYKQRDKYPYIFDHLTAEEHEEVLASNVFTVQSTHKDRKGREVALCEVSNWDPSNISIDALISYVLLSLERLIDDQDNQINGLVFAANLKGLSIKHVLRVNPFNLARIVTITVNNFPVRFKEIHFVNESKLFDIIFAILKPLLPKKLRERIVFHGSNLDSLHKHLIPDTLPEEFGGTMGTFSNAEWNKKLIANDRNMKSNKELGFYSSI